MAASPTLKNIGIGLAAGLVGTLVMTLGQRAEMALTDRPPSAAPAEAVETITGLDPDEGDEQLLSTLVHFGYGTALGRDRRRPSPRLRHRRVSAAAAAARKSPAGTKPTALAPDRPG